MSTLSETYEMIIGLEVHAQLLTRTKLFSTDSASFGTDPNTQISPVTLGYPGSLPVLNRKAVEYAIKMGIACHCEIERENYFARKNYFYPDLPKGYQISQHTTPVCRGGYVEIRTTNGPKQVLLNRIHLEEDAGKSLHDIDPENTCIDYNRAGVPLIEIVTDPVISSSEEAYAYLTELRKMLRYLEICDGNMEEGSMRCDANVSIRRKGEKKLGTKVEVKNLNSIRNVKRAIDYEVKRMTELAEKGELIVQQTRSFDAATGTSFALRSKEEANDYRYFADPDIPPFQVSDAMLKTVQESMPELPEQKVARYMADLKIPEYDARVICDDRDTATYFERVVSVSPHYKAAANWILGPVKSYLNEHHLDISRLAVTPQRLAGLIQLVEEGRINFSTASSRIFPEMIRRPLEDPLQLAESMNLMQNSDSREVAQWVQEALERMPDKVAEYKKGKKGLIGLFVGEVKKISKGKADPKLTSQLLLEKLEN
jgi:aspartyl-tRNA(Asn)/glutamyl-tRNA(Gln) amidotransferase subunit B